MPILNLMPEHPFYRPLWIRVLLVVITGGWSILEFLGHSPFWGTVVGMLCLYIAFELIWRYPEHRRRADAAEAAAAAATKTESAP